MFKDNYQYQHDYVRLATETGFFFEKRKSDSLDKNKISFVDIDRVIEERDIATVEKLIPNITQFVLDPDQVQVLDVVFVKTFCLSQLSIQYLLFCKRYLDNTVILLKSEIKKLKEENKELELFVEDLRDHISKLMKEVSEKPSFKCEQCNKLFSSEEFLNSHIKRRHSIQSSEIQKVETEKLHLEIKELKGRLNSAEKMFQKEQVEVNVVPTNETEIKKVDDLLQKFEDLRTQVQSELKVLQTQHNLEEKYEKLFEKLACQSNLKAVDKGGGGDLGRRRESTTQTEIHEDTKNIFKNTPDEMDKENIPDYETTQKQIVEFGEALQSKVSSSLEKIESQMQSFWKKLNEMEVHKRKYSRDDSEESERTLEQPKPVVRPRSKFVSKNNGEENKTIVNSPKRKTKDESSPIKVKQPSKQIEVEVYAVSPQPVKKTQMKPRIKKHLEGSFSDTVSSESNSEDIPMIPLPKKRTVIKKRAKYKNGIDDELIKHFRHEIENIINERLQELGVSPDWKGLPTYSFKRALEIVNHQANLMKKTYSNFDEIAVQIEKDLFEELKQKSSKPEKQTKAKVKLIKNTPAPIEIKNRKMYDTESESEIRPINVGDNIKRFSAPYSAVIEELKAVTTKIDSSDKSEEIGKNEETKGVLKNYPSVGSLTKKKVLFNLNKENDKEMLPVKDGGSTTSITSSVFDGTPRKTEKRREKDIEDLSDFDFSDM